MSEQPRPQRKPKSKPRAKKAAAAPWEDKAQVQTESSADPSSGEASSSDTSSSSSSGNSSSNSSSKSPVASAPAPPRPAPKKELAPAPKAAATRARVQSKKATDGRIPFGAHWLTPRHAPHSADIIAWQLTCNWPGHNRHSRCTRELRITSTSSSDFAQRVLKAYAVFGGGTPGKEEHKATWNDIIGLGDDMPSHLDLDAMLQAAESADAGGRVEDLVEVHAAAGNRGRRATRKRPQAALAGDAADEPLDGLGGIGAGVPQDVHEHALSLFNRGALPATTVEQRTRSRMTPGTGYHTPEALSPLLQWGYIHPNLRPPLGYYWQAGGGQWRLRPRGG